MLKIIGDIIWCLLSGMGIGFLAFLKVLPIYNELENLKEEIIACAIGVPAIIVSFVFLLPALIKLIKRL